MQNLRKLLFPFSFFLFGFFLPSQLGKHFWPPFAFVNGVRTDYLAPTIYLMDILLLFLVIISVLRASAKRTIQLKISFVLLATVFGLLYFAFAPIKLLFLYRAWQYIKIGLTALVFYKCSPKERLWFLYGLGTSLVYTLVLVLLQIFHQGSVQGVWWFFGERLFSITTPGIATITLIGQKIIRGYGTFSHPNSLAGFSVLAYALFALYNLPLLTVPAIFLVVLSFSKSGIIVFVLLFLFLEHQKSHGCVVCRVSKYLFGSWMLLLLLMFHGSEGTSYERIAGWNYAVDVLLKHPFGLSLGNYLYSGQPIHNIVLLLTTEVGFIGLMGLIGLISLMRPIRIMGFIKYKEVLLIFVILATGMVDHYWLTLQQNMLLLGVGIGFVITHSQNGRSHHSTQY